MPRQTISRFAYGSRKSHVAAFMCLGGTGLNVHDNVNDKTVAAAVTPTNCIAQGFQLR